MDIPRNIARIYFERGPLNIWRNISRKSFQRAEQKFAKLEQHFHRGWRSVFILFKSQPRSPVVIGPTITSLSLLVDCNGWTENKLSQRDRCDLFMRSHRKTPGRFFIRWPVAKAPLAIYWGLFIALYPPHSPSCYNCCYQNNCHFPLHFDQANFNWHPIKLRGQSIVSKGGNDNARRVES